MCSIIHKRGFIDGSDRGKFSSMLKREVLCSSMSEGMRIVGASGTINYLCCQHNMLWTRTGIPVFAAGQCRGRDQITPMGQSVEGPAGA